MYELVAVILTKNEAHNIAECIASLRDWVDAVIVWDSGSDDETVELAQSAGAQVIHHPFKNYAAQRQAALDSIAARWVFFVDADERATPELAAEIRQQLEETEHSGYWVPRINYIVGRETRGGGYYPDYQLRLLRRKDAWYIIQREVHEVVRVRGSESHLHHPLIHYNYLSWSQFHRKQRQYAAYEANILAKRGIHPRPHNFVLQPLREFHRRFIALRGWQDGLHGLRLALLFAWYYGFLPYWILLRMQ